MVIGAALRSLSSQVATLYDQLKSANEDRAARAARTSGQRTLLEQNPGEDGDRFFHRQFVSVGADSCCACTETLGLYRGQATIVSTQATILGKQHEITEKTLSGDSDTGQCRKGLRGGGQITGGQQQGTGRCGGALGAQYTRYVARHRGGRRQSVGDRVLSFHLIRPEYDDDVALSKFGSNPRRQSSIGLFFRNSRRAIHRRTINSDRRGQRRFGRGRGERSKRHHRYGRRIAREEHGRRSARASAREDCRGAAQVRVLGICPVHRCPEGNASQEIRVRLGSQFSECLPFHDGQYVQPIGRESQRRPETARFRATLAEIKDRSSIGCSRLRYEYQS